MDLNVSHLKGKVDLREFAPRLPVLCPCVGKVVFVPEGRGPLSESYALPGQIAVWESVRLPESGRLIRTRKFRQHFVGIRWIEDYAAAVRKPVEWRNEALLGQGSSKSSTNTELVYGPYGYFSAAG